MKEAIVIYFVAVYKKGFTLETKGKNTLSSQPLDKLSIKNLYTFIVGLWNYFLPKVTIILFLTCLSCNIQKKGVRNFNRDILLLKL